MLESITISKGHKWCSRCKQLKPLSAFSRNASKSSGYNSWCIECHREYSQQRAKGAKSIPVTKRCSQCGAEKTSAEFYKTRYSKDGLAAWCKSCANAYHQRYSQCPEGKEAHVKASQKYRKSANGRRKIKAYNYQYNRRSDVKARRRRLFTTEKYKSYGKKWRQKNRLWSRANNQKRRARERGAPGQYTKQDIHQIYSSQRGRCWYCQKEISLSDMHIDHRIPLSRGGSNYPENLVATCPQCNLSKNRRLPHEWCGRLL